jgi:hypothetical protein
LGSVAVTRPELQVAAKFVRALSMEAEALEEGCAAHAAGG